MNDKVSIIIPTRNRHDLLRQAVRSARAQTWPDMELLIVDEASTDGTADMLAAEFADVQIVKHRVPRGPGGARNSGLGATDSNWVMFFDDDDLLHPQHVESLVLASRNLTDDVSIVSGRWRRFTLVSDEIRLGPVVCAPRNRRGIETLAELLEPNGEGTIWTASVLWPRRIFADVLWDDQLSTNGDVDFVGRVILSGKQIVGRQAGMAYYRAHLADRVSGGSTLRRLLSSTRYRLKWSELLLSHPEHRVCAASMRNGLMALIIGLSGVSEASELMPLLQDAYRLWGGRGYYMSSPPRNPLKRLITEGALKLGGPAALHWLLEKTSRPTRNRDAPFSGYHLPVTDADKSDVSAICSLK